VPAICRLFRIGSALLGSFGIIASAISPDHFSTWMLTQPLGQGFGFPIRQKINWHALFEINQDGADLSKQANIITNFAGDPASHGEVSYLCC
jgi:hypothetical protein